MNVLNTHLVWEKKVLSPQTSVDCVPVCGAYSRIRTAQSFHLFVLDLAFLDIKCIPNSFCIDCTTALKPSLAPNLNVGLLAHASHWRFGDVCLQEERGSVIFHNSEALRTSGILRSSQLLYISLSPFPCSVVPFRSVLTFRSVYSLVSITLHSTDHSPIVPL